MPVHGNSLTPPLNQIFNSLKQIEDSAVQASMLRGTLAGLSGKRDLSPPGSSKALRVKLARSKDPEVVKLADQLSQIFGDLSVSEDALKLVLNGEANLDERKEALGGLVRRDSRSYKTSACCWAPTCKSMRFGLIPTLIIQKLPRN